MPADAAAAADAAYATPLPFSLRYHAATPYAVAVILRLPLLPRYYFAAAALRY